METINVSSPMDKNPASAGKQKIELTPGVEKKLPDPFIEPLPEIPEKVGELFPSVVHELISAKGRVFDHGWKIKWFDSEEEAKQNTEKYKREAESLYLTKNFFENLKGPDEDLPKLEYPSINTGSKEDIMQFSGIKNFKFKERVITHDTVSLDGYMYKDSPGTDFKTYHDFLLQEGELLISTKTEYGRYGENSHNLEHFYNVAIKNGANKEDLDKKILDNYKNKIKEIKQKIKEQLEKVDLLKYENHFSSSGSRIEIPRLAGSEIHLRDKVFEFRELLESNDYDVNTAEECLKTDFPLKLESSLNYLNSDIDTWNKFWKGSFSQINEKIKNKEIIINFGGHFRRMGRAGLRDLWVIKANGDIRPPTSVEYRKGYFDEGEKNWDVVTEEEATVSWFGEDVEINKIPKELTKEQKISIEKLQKELGQKEEEPNLLNEEVKNNNEENLDSSENNEIEETEETYEQKLQALKDKFKK